jgi:hypothetical protein
MPLTERSVVPHDWRAAGLTRPRLAAAKSVAALAQMMSAGSRGKRKPPASGPAAAPMSRHTAWRASAGTRATPGKSHGKERCRKRDASKREKHHTRTTAQP